MHVCVYVCMYVCTYTCECVFCCMPGLRTRIWREKGIECVRQRQTPSIHPNEGGTKEVSWTSAVLHTHIIMWTYENYEQFPPLNESNEPTWNVIDRFLIFDDFFGNKIVGLKEIRVSRGMISIDRTTTSTFVIFLRGDFDVSLWFMKKRLCWEKKPTLRRVCCVVSVSIRRKSSLTNSQDLSDFVKKSQHRKGISFFVNRTEMQKSVSREVYKYTLLLEPLWWWYGGLRLIQLSCITCHFG